MRSGGEENAEGAALLNVITLYEAKQFEAALAAAETMLAENSEDEVGVAKLRNLSLSYELMLTPMHFKMHEARVRQTGMLNEAARLIDAGKIKVVISNTFAMDQIDQAHDVVEAGHSIGKTVIKIN